MIEQEPEFKTFVSALLRDALRRPKKLRDVKEVWDKEWEALLKDVPRGLFRAEINRAGKL